MSVVEATNNEQRREEEDGVPDLGTHATKERKHHTSNEMPGSIRLRKCNRVCRGWISDFVHLSFHFRCATCAWHQAECIRGVQYETKFNTARDDAVMHAARTA